MNRRSFLSGLSALVGGVLLEKAVPLGRVWSFPKHIVPLNCADSKSVWKLASPITGRHYDLIVYDDLVSSPLGFNPYQLAVLRQFNDQMKYLDAVGSINMRVPTEILENV